MTARSLVAEKVMVSRHDDHVPDLSFLRGARRPAGSGDSLTVTVGGASVRLSGLEPERRRTLERRYGIFCLRPPAQADLEIQVGSTDIHEFLKVQQPDEYYRIRTTWEADTLVACSYEWAGWIDLSARTGGLTLAGVALESPRAYDRSLENFLRVAFAHLMVPRGGFLLHSASLVRGGRAYLFFGPSGSGKTTVTTLTPEALILSDDLTMVVRTPAGDYHACSVPFRGVFAPEPTTVETWPIAGFFRLVQDTSDRLVEVSGAHAVGELVGSLPFVTERAELAGPVIDSVAGAASKVKVFRLHFRKDRTFWQAVDARCAVVDDFSAIGGIKP